MQSLLFGNVCIQEKMSKKLSNKNGSVIITK